MPDGLSLGSLGGDKGPPLAASLAPCDHGLCIVCCIASAGTEKRRSPSFATTARPGVMIYSTYHQNLDLVFAATVRAPAVLGRTRTCASAYYTTVGDRYLTRL